jgi:hypothetical protein
LAAEVEETEMAVVVKMVVVVKMAVAAESVETAAVLTV